MSRNPLIRKKEESLEDYHIRLFENMDNYGLNSEEIAELLNKESGMNYSESKWRKDYSQYVKWKDYILKNNSSTDELEKLTIKKLELQKERSKLSSEKHEINKWVREQARTENIYEKITDAIEKLRPIEIPSFKNKTTNKSRTAIIDIADTHYGREGKIEGLKGEIIAEYSVEIFERRMWELLEKSISIIEKEKLSHVTVLNLSDSIDGLLRFSQLQFLQLGVVDQTIQFAEFMSNWLNSLSEYVSIDYRSCMGNHTEIRHLGAGRGDFTQENMEKIITYIIKERLKNNDRIKVYDAKNLVYFNIFETYILATHGQDERNIENSIRDYRMMYDVPIHILKTGHLHHGKSKVVSKDGSGLQNIEVIQSPAICGIDEYSMRLKKTSNAGTFITVFEEGYGKYITYDIRLK